MSHGRLVLGRRNPDVGGGHIDLAGGGPVLGAGEVRFVNGKIKWINNKSGHYKPQGPEAQQATEAAFLAAGLDPTGAYSEFSW